MTEAIGAENRGRVGVFAGLGVQQHYRAIDALQVEIAGRSCRGCSACGSSQSSLRGHVAMLRDNGHSDPAPRRLVVVCKHDDRLAADADRAQNLLLELQ